MDVYQTFRPTAAQLLELMLYFRSKHGDRLRRDIWQPGYSPVAASAWLASVFGSDPAEPIVNVLDILNDLDRLGENRVHNTIYGPGALAFVDCAHNNKPNASSRYLMKVTVIAFLPVGVRISVKITTTT